MNLLKTIALLGIAGLLFGSCRKDPMLSTYIVPPAPSVAHPPLDGVTLIPEFDSIRADDSGPIFTTYTIPAGQNYCIGNDYQPDSFRILRFQAIFDSSCIYTSADPINQYDINKLLGFADSATFHHRNSARFGWNWEGGAMHIHAYCYRSGLRESQELGTVSLNAPHDFSIEVRPLQYIFTLNGRETIMQRSAPEPVALGYKLLPYFGGDEPAPHEVRIQIREQPRP